MKNSICDGCTVIETISVLKIPQVQGSMQLAGKVAEDQIVYENEASGLKSLKMNSLLTVACKKDYTRSSSI